MLVLESVCSFVLTTGGGKEKGEEGRRGVEDSGEEMGDDNVGVARSYVS